ncbi:acyl-CoA-binding domain-containing protein 6-like [Palaemon carinicauda]|uniref:acyl-CoA-binding domain-containing protein 6-like n=1 Tax=Palaemon carinicauda TaxID=392227 RepID=UPI0035B67456
MDDLEEYSPQVGELEATFTRAANYLQGLAATLPSEKLLFFYGRYKQALDGPCLAPKPGFFDFKGKQKWDAWKALGEMSKEDAMKEYIDGISEVDGDWQIKAPTDGKHSGTSSWVKVSSLAVPEEDDDKSDKDKNHFDWVKENDIPKVKCLSDKTLSDTDENGMTLLHWAADRGYLEMTEVLLEKGIDVNSQDTDGQTALHYAVSCGHQAVIRALLSHGADLNIADADGQLPMDCADEEIKELLK